MKANFPPIGEISGVHSIIYEAWFRHVDSKQQNCIAALDAARFLKQSGLADSDLGKIWDMADPGCRGVLDKTGFYVALKLVALAQNNKPVDTCNLRLNVPPPNMGSAPPLNVVPATNDTVVAPGVGSSVWTIGDSERQRYSHIFNTLGPQNGRLPGSKVREVLMNSKLPVDVLGKIWDLSDLDKDGLLDAREFNIAMHLVYRVLEKHPVPESLPGELLQSSSSPAGQCSSAANSSASPSAVSSLNSAFSAPGGVQRWVVGGADKARYDIMFRGADLDRDGYVSGAEIKDVFLKSALPQLVLAHIWNLCDMKQTGKLNSEQFALAMYLLERKLAGDDLPERLTEEMVPPTLRPKPAVPAPPLSHNSDAVVQPAAVAAAMAYDNAELQEMHSEIQAMIDEQKQLQTDIHMKESQLQGHTSEVSTLQRELDTLTATLKQLEGQRGAAQDKLDNLASQVEKLRVQVSDQESTLQCEEKELLDRRNQLNQLRTDQLQLDSRVKTADKRQHRLDRVLEDLLFQISQAKSKTGVMQECERQLQAALKQCEQVLQQEDVSLITEAIFHVDDSPFTDATFVDIQSNLSPEVMTPESPAAIDSGGVNNSHLHTPEKAKPPARPASPFSQLSDSRAAGGQQFAPAAAADPFAAWDQPLVAVAGGSCNVGSGSSATGAGSSDVDAFGTDPFEALRPPSRATPEPVTKKAPPPRPAPPKNAPARPPPPSFSKKPTAEPQSSAGFADFANFDQFVSDNGPSSVFPVSSSSPSSVAIDPWSPVDSLAASSTSAITGNSSSLTADFSVFSALPSGNSQWPVKDASACNDIVSDPFTSLDPFSASSGSMAAVTTAAVDVEDPFSKEDPFSDSDPFSGSDPFSSSADIFSGSVSDALFDSTDSGLAGRPSSAAMSFVSAASETSTSKATPLSGNPGRAQTPNTVI